MVALGAAWSSGRPTRRMADARLNEWTETPAVPTVEIAALDQRGGARTLDLPGVSRLFAGRALCARSGYLKEWKADIGRR